MFTDQHRKSFRVRLEQGGLRSDPYAEFIPGQHGDIYIHAPGVFGVSTHRSGGIARKLRGLAFVTIRQDGDDGINATFPAERFKAVAKLVKPRRRRQLTAEQRANLAKHGAKWLFKGSNSRSDAENVTTIDRAGLNA